MRIAIDARPALDPRRTGVGRYTRNIVRHLPVACPTDEVVAWYLDPSGFVSRRRRFDEGAANLVERPLPFPIRPFQALSWRLGVPKLEWLVRFDALLATNFLPPATDRRGVVLVVHDLASERYPDTAPHHDDRWRRRFDAWLRRAGGVVVPSESTRADLLSRHDVDGGLVRVIPHGAEAFRRPADDVVEQIRARLGVGGPYALFVGGIEPRKNLSLLVSAFASLGDQDAWLVIAGGRTGWVPHAVDLLAAEVAALPERVRRRVVLTGRVSELDRHALLSGALALAYPSRYEGFGFPVLEAFAAGVPVLTSNTSALSEVAGDAGLLVDPNDREAIADGLARLFGDPALRDRLVEAGSARVRAFTWEASAAATAEVLSAAAHR